MTIQTAVLIETLVDLGAEVRWVAATSSRPRTTRAAADRRHAGVAGLRLEGRDARRVLVVHAAGAHLARRPGPELIVDDGGDATLLVHRGSPERERLARRTLDRDERGVPVVKQLLNEVQALDPSYWPTRQAALDGVSEETTTGVHRLYQMAGDGRTARPRDQRQRLGHQVASSTTSTAAATRSSMASSAPPTS